MQAKYPISFERDRIVSFCRKWKISEFAFFGSILRDDFRPDSDVDVMVSFEQGARWSLFDLAAMEAELKEVFGRAVDLVERASVEKSENFIRREAVLSNIEAVYVER
ncbi:MAG: nucleotidyltransferase domain-containing protein [Planctomycetes bacterium]|nr:nucleotidyltransferase domain-containing protein [Planctomycetota bacterium]